VLLKLRDYSGALAAYQAYLEAGASGANRREAEKIVNNLRAVESTFLDISLSGGPAAAIYLDSRTQGVFCTAAPACHKAVLPGDYKVIAEQSGFDRWTGQVTIASGATATLAVALVEKPSELTVRVAQPGARVTLDGGAYEATTKIAAGSHRVAVSLAGYLEARQEVTAHAGTPVTLEVALTPLVRVQVSPPTATLLLDDKPVVIAQGSIAVPPGGHVVLARAPRFRERRIEVPAVRAPGYQLVIALDPAPESEPVRAEAIAAPAPASRFTGQRKIALMIGGVGLGIAAGGVLLHRQSNELDDQARTLCPSSDGPCADGVAASAIRQRSSDRAHQATIAYGLAGGAAVVAAAVWLLGGPEPGIAVAVMPRLGQGPGLDVAVRF
jgi:hypothetical protein